MSESNRAAVAVGLSRELIVTTALDLVDRQGLDSFSVRTVARELGVNPTAVTWHVGSRDRLLSAVGQLVLADLSRPLKRGPWDQRIRTIARRFRSALHAHPNAAALIGTRLTANMGDHLEILENLLEALHKAGLDGRRQRNALNALVGAVIGFVTLELATPPDDEQRFADEVRHRAAQVDPVALPQFTLHRNALANRSFVYRWSSGVDAPLDDAFETLLTLLIVGISSSAAAEGKPT